MCDHYAKYTDWPNQLGRTGYECGVGCKIRAGTYAIGLISWAASEGSTVSSLRGLEWGCGLCDRDGMGKGMDSKHAGMDGDWGEKSSPCSSLIHSCSQICNKLVSKPRHSSLAAAKSRMILNSGSGLSTLSRKQ